MLMARTKLGFGILSGVLRCSDWAGFNLGRFALGDSLAKLATAFADLFQNIVGFRRWVFVHLASSAIRLASASLASLARK